MALDTHIAWCDDSLNAWWGCTEVDPACDNCYAKTLSERFDKAKWGQGEPRMFVKSWRNTLQAIQRKARAEGRRRRVFVESMGDLFDNQVPDEWRRDLFEAIRQVPECDFLLLTKRIGNARAMLPSDWPVGFEHCWLGISAGTQQALDRDAPKLFEIPASVRWMSAEPLLEPLWLGAGPAWDWIVIGGESGRHRRNPGLPAFMALASRCEALRIPLFVKQAPAARPGTPFGIEVLDRWKEWPNA